LDTLGVSKSTTQHVQIEPRRRVCRTAHQGGVPIESRLFFSKEIPMRHVMATNRAMWLACGLLAGLAIAYVWPHEPAYATTGDRDTQFSMVTCQVGVNAAGITDAML
jgi:hypothetical protein